jgi:hypothetical protein
VTSRHLSRIALLTAFAGLLLGWVMRHSETSLIDGLRSIEEARRIDKGQVARGLAEAVDHPLHPLGIAATHRIFFRGDSPASWQRSAVLLSFLAILLWVPPLYLLGLELLGDRPAWIVCLLAVSNPTIGFIFVNVLSECVFLIWWTWGLWASARFLRRGRFSWLLAAIAFGTLAYWTRPEGLLLPIALAATLLLLPLHPATRINWPRWSWALALLIIGSAVLVGPYMALKGTPATRPAIARVLGLAPAADPLGLERERPLDLTQPLTEIYRRATFRMAGVTLAAVAPALLPFTLLGLVACRPWKARPRTWLLFAAITAASAVGLIRLHATGGYCTVRHALVPGLFLTLLAANGWDWLIDRVAIPGRWLPTGLSANPGLNGADLASLSYRPGPAIWLAVLALVAILPGMRHLGPARPGPFWLYRSAADYLTTLAEPDERILDLTDWSLFFSGRPGYHFAEVFAAPADLATRWIVVTAPHVDGERSFSPVVRDLIGDREPIISIPPLPDRRQLQLRIYDRTPGSPETRIADANK